MNIIYLKINSFYSFIFFFNKQRKRKESNQTMCHLLVVIRLKWKKQKRGHKYFTCGIPDVHVTSNVGVRGWQLLRHFNRRSIGGHKENNFVSFTLAFSMLKQANPSLFCVSSKMTDAVINCTLYCIEY